MDIKIPTLSAIDKEEIELARKELQKLFDRMADDFVNEAKEILYGETDNTMPMA